MLATPGWLASPIIIHHDEPPSPRAGGPRNGLVSVRPGVGARCIASEPRTKRFLENVSGVVPKRPEESEEQEGSGEQELVGASEEKEGDM
eukprot:COSAG04_NODE_1964_length_5118_cov_53.889221_2_plen_90_part_00